MLTGLDLFTGIGGMSIALQQWVRPVAYCENDRYCQSILLNNIHDNLITSAPIWDDIRSLSTCMFSEIDIIYGGFPCQDISVAGHGKGLAGERSGLYWEIHRLAKEIMPKYVFLENVPAICTKGGWDVVSSLAEMGYDCRWCVISAAAIGGALHRRERWFCLARNALYEGFFKIQKIQRKEQAANPAGIDNAAHSSIPFKSIEEWREACSTICRTTNGVPCRVERIKALGNAVVPAQCKKAFEILAGIEK